MWSCCKRVSKNSPGCTTGPHIEGSYSTDLFHKFEILAIKGNRADALSIFNREIRARGGTETFKCGSVINRKPDGDYLMHEVRRTDTLAGLALKYNTNITILKQVNRLYSTGELYKLKYIKVPNPNPGTTPPPPSPSPDTPTSAKRPFSYTWSLQKLVEATGACQEEALFYLEDNGWDAKLARESRELDIQWAEGELRRRKTKLKEILGDMDVETVAVVGVGAAIVLLCVVL